jgi:hypothetical protein
MKSTKVSTPKAELPVTPLRPRDPEILRCEMPAVQLAIARRAFELFEKRGGECGHDWEDWFQAESELLHPEKANLASSPNGLPSLEKEKLPSVRREEKKSTSNQD